MKALIVLFTLCTSAIAAELKIEPVYGFERTYREQPAPARYKTEIFTGIRGTYGFEFLAGELELNQAISDDNDVKYTTQNLLIGARLTPGQSDIYNIYFRSGMRAKKESREYKVNGENRTTSDGIQWDPYAGAGLTLNLINIFALNTSATLVFNRDAEGAERYDTRYTFGFSIKFGNK
jgi:hypothetical protein